MAEHFDVIVIGAGPAGYVAAIRCAQLGLNTACVDDWVDAGNQAVLGGTCLNAGCIPSKVLLEASEIYDKARKEFSSYGVSMSAVELDLATMMARKDRIVSELTQGIAALFKSNGVTWLKGRGRLLVNKQVEVRTSEAVKGVYGADHVIIAAGSRPVEIGAAPLDGDRIVDSAGALSFDEVPEKLGVIGAGVIGLELGSVWRRLGSEVVLLEAQEEFLSMVDAQIAAEALKQYRKQGLDIRLGARVVSCELVDGKVNIHFKIKEQDHQQQVDKLIVAVGREPNSKDLFAGETELLLDEWGYIHVSNRCQTNIPGVYAIGDIVRGPMLAHKGQEEGIMVAELIAGRHAEVNYDIIPSVIYTRPEIAWVGQTEQFLKASGRKYTSGVFPFAASGRARALGDTVGMIKVLADAETDRILGVHMIGAHCSELLAQAVIAMEIGLSSEDIAMTMFAHPTLSEAFHEAALAVRGQAIHIAQAKSRKG